MLSTPKKPLVGLQCTNTLHELSRKQITWSKRLLSASGGHAFNCSTQEAEAMISVIYIERSKPARATH